MSQFKLQWDNSGVLANVNATGQRANYRRRSVGGAFNTSGFSPSNDLPKAANTTDSPTLLENIVYEFKVQTLCTVSGPTDNDNGIQEAISFVCLVPNISKTGTTATATISVTGLDITKIRFTLKKSVDNSIVLGPTIVNPVAGVVTFNMTGLVENTNYYLQFEMYATVNTVEVISSGGAYLGIACSPYPFSTDPLPVCASVTNIVVDSIEI